MTSSLKIWSPLIQEVFMSKKKSFFERLTGSVRLDEDEMLEEEEEEQELPKKQSSVSLSVGKNGKKVPTNESSWMQDEAEEGQLTLDVYQTPTDIVIQTMVAGVRPEDLQINIARDMVTIRGKREESKNIDDGNFFCRELYWGTFSRTISLPQEIEPDDAEATEKHGLLTIRLPKIDKSRQTMLKVKSI